MADLIELALEEGGTIWIEVTEDAPDAGVAGHHNLAEGVSTRSISDRTTRSFESTLGGLQRVANSLHGVLNNLASKPSSVTVEFGVKFTASSGVIIASGSGEANLKVGMAWTTQSDDA